MSNKAYKHVNYNWNEAVADKLDSVERLRYRSNILGDDQRITNTGGGNTSSKVMMNDPLTGEEADILWVKGSGGDLRTSTRANFASLYMDKLLSLQEIYDAAEIKGVKTEIEDQMVSMYPHTTFNLNPRASSIDTPLHGFIPYRHVDHMHPISAIAIAASKDQEKLTQDVFGDEVGWVPWQRPGFDLGLVMGQIASENPQLKGLIMGQHGLINWANDDKECYELTLNLIEKAAEYIVARDKGPDTFGGAKFQALPEAEREELLIKLLPTLRGMVSQQNRFIGTIHATESVLEFVNSHDAARLAEIGTSCPDHFLRTKIKPLFVDWNPQTDSFETLLEKIGSGLVQYRDDYAAYYEACKHPNSPAMRDPNPTVILIPGVGLIAWGKNKSESRVTAEFYSLAIQVMRASEAISQYQGLPVYVVQSTFGGAEGYGNVCSNGGGLSSIGVSFTVINSLFTHNDAIGYGANPAQSGTPGGGSGGAIYNDGNTFTLTVIDTVIEDNHANEGGGAIFFVSNDRSGTLRIEDSTLRRNPSDSFETRGYPGIFYLGSGPIQVINSTIE